MIERHAFLVRLRRRKIAQWSLAYLAGGWITLQVMDLAADAFGWPSAVLRTAWTTVGIGFLAVLIIAWYHGQRGEQRVRPIEILLLTGVVIVGAGAVGTISMGGRMVAPGDGAIPADTRAGGTPEDASVVVLPFADLSPRGDQEYFSDGLTEEILNALVKIPDLRVPARTTSFAFKGKNLTVREIARQLNVAHVLEGSVRKEGNRLRVTVQLVDARADRHLWSETYDRRMADVFEVQQDIANAVVSAMGSHLQPSSSTDRAGGIGLAAGGTRDPAAYELYLHGLSLWNQRGAEGLRKAAEYFQAAVQQDTGFARGWAGLALTYALIPEYADLPAHDWASRARSAAARALARDPGLAEAHTAIAYADMLEWRMADAAREFQRAIRVNPRYATAHQWYAVLLNATGRASEALVHMRQALSLDPLSFIINANLGDLLVYAGRYDEAASRYGQALALSSTEHGFYEALYGVALHLGGREADARAVAARMRPHVREADVMSYGMLAYLLGITGGTAEARAMADRMDERARTGYVSPVIRAYARMGIGDHERAISLLEEGLAVRDPQLLYYVANDPGFDPIRGDPRFRRIAEPFLGR